MEAAVKNEPAYKKTVFNQLLPSSKICTKRTSVVI